MPRTFRGKGSYIPKSDKYSAQNIPDTSTPAGTSAVNEEFRRIAGIINDRSVTEEATIATRSSGSDSTPQVTETEHNKHRLTVEHNGIPVISLDVENIDVEDSESVLFDVVSYTPRKVEITARTAESGLYKATRVGQVLYSKNGSTFRRELPLTSLVSGVILNSDGVIMITG